MDGWMDGLPSQLHNPFAGLDITAWTDAWNPKERRLSAPTPPWIPSFLLASPQGSRERCSDSRFQPGSRRASIARQLFDVCPPSLAAWFPWMRRDCRPRSAGLAVLPLLRRRRRRRPYLEDRQSHMPR